MAEFRRARRSSWLTGDSGWIAVLWFAVSLVTAAQVVIGMAAVRMHHNWTLLFLVTVAAWLIFPVVRRSSWP